MTVKNKIKLITVLGPTASGKTALSVEIAKVFNCEIISADSMQIYKGMNIATAKPTKDEMQSITHHLIDIVESDKKYSVAQFVADARKAIDEISARGKTPLICGGTGLYIDSLLNNVDFSTENSDENLRTELQITAQEKGADYILEMLSEFDLESAKRLSKEKNVKRIIRSIEVYKTTGITQTEQNKIALKNESPYDSIKIGLTCKDRQKLYDRINLRVDNMIKDGLLAECEQVISKPLSKTAVMAIGYKELIPYFKGEKTLTECIEKLKTETRRYAKRQLTWFRRDESINWVYTDIFKSTNEIYEYVFSLLEKEGFVKNG